MKFEEHKQFDLPGIEKKILSYWKKNEIFEKSISQRSKQKKFVFYEGPPSANGLPGIHHVLSRTIKDLFCRYKTMKGYQVPRKGGWDTHGLPVELSVEKSLGITKEDIGKKLSIEEYNQACRKDVLKYKESWDDLTNKMGYWVDLDNPYITFENKYIESVWYLLKKLFDQEILYKGYTVQPYSPAAGTGLSTHELNLPGCYRDLSDTSIAAQFKIIRDEHSEKLYDSAEEVIHFLAWTTTPWTLPANCALAVGKKIKYVKVNTFNAYTFERINVFLAVDLVDKYFSPSNKKMKKVKEITELDNYKQGEGAIPFCVGVKHFTGGELENVNFEQLMPYVQPKGDAFRVILGDFVSTEEGTGIVHTASVFGSDDFRVCQQNGISSIMVTDENGDEMPLVDKQGRFVKEVTDFAGEYVREEYYSDEIRNAKDFKSTDVLIVIKLKEENKAFLVEKYVHSYPHCWRTDKPIIYYPLDSWFIKTTSMKEKMIDLNNTINWQPEYTGTGRFGNWLENLQDWNLSRSRFWGIPIPIWSSENGAEHLCIGSVEQLKEEIEKAIAGGMMKSNPLAEFEPSNFSKDNYEKFDLHKPYVDDIILISDKGTELKREPDLIDVWFDSGAMPYAQLHYPFENEELFETNFPADFISEGVDQTRGWFFTLHVIATMLFDSVAFKNVLSHGLVLDKDGNKMSKRIGNVVDPFKIIEQYGADVTRWYLVSNSQLWENIKFGEAGIAEIQRKFFGTLYNTYSFFALYANIDEFINREDPVPLSERSELDRWIISLLNSLIVKVDKAYYDYEPTIAAREIQNFVSDHLSNWYVRLCRRRFWKGEYSKDKISAYQTLFECLMTVAKLMAPVAPFYADKLFQDLNLTEKDIHSIHLSDFPEYDESVIDKELEERMSLAQDISSLVLSLRRRADVKVRQPLQKILIPILDEGFEEKIEQVRSLILSEINVKEIEYVSDTAGRFNKKIRPDFQKMGKKYGPKMKAIAGALSEFTQEDIRAIETNGSFDIKVENESVQIALDEVEIVTEDIPGWLVANQGNLTVALDINLSDSLIDEGIARELVNKIQNLRKEMKFNVTDRIVVEIEKLDWIEPAIKNNFEYICSEILAEKLDLSDSIDTKFSMDLNDKEVKLLLSRVEN